MTMCQTDRVKEKKGKRKIKVLNVLLPIKGPLCIYSMKCIYTCYMFTRLQPIIAFTVLSHVMPGGEEKPIAYASWTFSKAERNYAQIERGVSDRVWGKQVPSVPLW